MSHTYDGPKSKNIFAFVTNFSNFESFDIKYNSNMCKQYKTNQCCKNRCNNWILVQTHSNPKVTLHGSRPGSGSSWVIEIDFELIPEAFGLHVTAQTIPHKKKRPPAMIPSAYIHWNGCFFKTIHP